MYLFLVTDENNLHIHVDAKNVEAEDIYKCLLTSATFSTEVCKSESLQEKKKKKWKTGLNRSYNQ